MKKLYIIAGSNGAGKTTAAYVLLPKLWRCEEFVNADEIARGLSPFYPQRESVRAGRMMLEKMHSLLESGRSFAFETTLAGIGHRRFVEKAKQKGYQVSLFFFWLPSPDLAVERVASRVREGGHGLPQEIIKRRYERGLKNFFNVFKPLVDEWRFIDNSNRLPKIVAQGSYKTKIYDTIVWEYLLKKYKGEKNERHVNR